MDCTIGMLYFQLLMKVYPKNRGPKEQEAKSYRPEQRRDFMTADRITTLVILSEDHEEEGE